MQNTQNQKNMPIHTVKVPEMPGIARYGKISTLHVYDHAGRHRQWNGSSVDGGYFTALFASRRGIIGLLQPVIPLTRPGTYSDHPDGLHAPGLFIICHDFNPVSDWLVAQEEDCGCDPGYKYSLILGSRHLGAAGELIRNMAGAFKVVGAEHNLPFERFDLQGSVLGLPSELL